MTSLSQADAIQPSYSAVDPTLLNSAGITTGRRAIDDDPEPGSETIDRGPRGLGDDGSDSDTIDETDLLNPFEDPDGTSTTLDRRVPDRSRRHP